MAFWEIDGVQIKGICGAVPDNPVSSFDLDLFSAEEAQIFVDTVGIRQRYVAPEGMCASDLCHAAAEKLIAGLQWDKSEIGLLAFESVTRDHRTPPTSCILQERLKLSEKCFTLDIPMGCCGFMYGMIVTGSLLQSSSIQKAILLIGDTATRMGSPRDKSRVPLFGDCGVAVALEFDVKAKSIKVEMNTDGKGHKALFTPHSEFRHPVTPASFEYEDFGKGVIRRPADSLIDGMEVFSFAISKPVKDMQEFMRAFCLDKENDIDYFLIHQANKLIVDRIVNKLKLPMEKVPYNLEEFGNTGGASIPFLLATRLREQAQSQSLRLLLTSFGLGLTWGTTWLETSPMLIPELIKLKV